MDSTAASRQHIAPSYDELNKFQECRKQLNVSCHQLSRIIRGCNYAGVLPFTLAENAEQVFQKIQSKRFRVAIAGEFSRGKSTLINALIGKDIQPVRAIACSNAITILKYGVKERIACSFKDGRKEEVSFERYQELVRISKEAARNNLSDELARSEIEEIVFEHPNLELCQNGVEIVDSPGLNEHPDRTAITQKLLKDTDALIFLTNASQILTYGERNLIQELRVQINSGNENEPANNLFIVVNKMDQLDSEEDRQDVRVTVQQFAYGQSPIVTGKDRVHFISALKVVAGKSENQHLKAFHDFTHSLTRFLTRERGYIEIERFVTELKGIIKTSLSMFQQTERSWNSNIEASEMKKQLLIEQVGELSGHNVRISTSVEQWIKELTEQLSREIYQSWYERFGIEGSLEYRLSKKAEGWSCQRDPVWDQTRMVEDYAKLCIEDLLNEINAWANKDLTEIVEQKLKNLDARIESELEKIQQDSDRTLNYVQSFNPNTIDSFQFELSQKDLYGDLWRWITCTLFIGYFFGSAEAIQKEMKEKVVHDCLVQLHKVSNNLLEEIYRAIPLSLKNQLELVDAIITRAILSHEACLEQQEIKCRKIVEQCEDGRAWFTQKCQELEQVQKSLEAILNICNG